MSQHQLGIHPLLLADSVYDHAAIACDNALLIAFTFDRKTEIIQTNLIL